MADVRSSFSIEAADAKKGLTLGELKKLLATLEEHSEADDDAPIKVKVGWKSQITRIEIG
ncbi:hypothetical protein KGG85_gp78 [Streptomyces phage Tefunt]|uniref:Uncharacterized protein n=1 Tax=Streptomyces phage Tefunt TaxID=2041209 RepID=A0A291LI20_9CAUD|nr:hypothetical protein KGG85_gp78 [Streptomyces phage Tefunt]ATI19018.1 hypothetical protein SEA_TEFUNT_78 [Streptomyces phage Tefunt]AXH70282.1 hypothetical protein SEA_HAIZUM_78 [Streptomyces phage Haizum]QAY15820.1 hypothetical protein SEA_NISHIKIGOI_79 [Streptomyces phage Nishikigoi]